MSAYKYSSNVRLLLYNHFYNNPSIIQYINNSIIEKFELFNIDYNEINHSIELKIKKTAIRKNSCFSHTVNYYYPIFSQIFYNVFHDNKDLLQRLIIQYKDEYNLIGNELDYILNIDSIPMILNITTLNDNIVIVYL